MNTILGSYKLDGTESSLDTCDYVQIELFGNIAKNRGVCMLISRSDVSNCLNYKWYLSKAGYPVTYSSVDNKEKFGGIKIHRFLEPLVPKDMVVDHINRDRLDNRRTNLRICTIAENGYNKTRTKKYKGVRRLKSGWIASVTKDGTKHEIKNIPTEKQAAEMYDIMAEELFGNFAAKNFDNNI
jgi:hypothetical protein